MLRRPMLLSALLFFFINISACSSPEKEPSGQICFSDGCIQIEIARTQEERMKGFQNRKFLSQDRGMLFIFPNTKKHSFWMKDTLIALDIIWIDDNKRVVTIMPGVLPCETEQCPVYAPSKDARYVLEVNSGVAFELGVKEGDHVFF